MYMHCTCNVTCRLHMQCMYRMRAAMSIDPNPSDYVRAQCLTRLASHTDRLRQTPTTPKSTMANEATPIPFHDVPSQPASPEPKRTKLLNTEPAEHLSVACTYQISTSTDTDTPPTSMAEPHH
jgi:hypothetical protein